MTSTAEIDRMERQIQMETEAAPRSVVEAIVRVIRDLPAVGKDERNRDQGYNYRGIEQITAAVQPLFGRHGVVVVPKVRELEIRDIVINGKPWTDTHAQVEYIIYGTNGPDDYLVVGPFHSIGRDNSDKGVNKAMTQAYKQMLLQVLAVADKKDDPDEVSKPIERDAPQEPQEAPGVGAAIAEPFYKSAEKQGVDRETIDAWAKELAGVESLAQVPRTQWNLLRDRYAVHLQEIKLSAAPPAANPGTPFAGDATSAPGDEETPAPASNGEQDTEPEGAVARGGAVELGSRARKPRNAGS